MTQGAAAPQQSLVPVEFLEGGRSLRFLAAIITLGTPQDVSLRELRIESFVPTNEVARAAVQDLR